MDGYITVTEGDVMSPCVGEFGCAAAKSRSGRTKAEISKGPSSATRKVTRVCLKGCYYTCYEGSDMVKGDALFPICHV